MRDVLKYTRILILHDLYCKFLKEMNDVKLNQIDPFKGSLTVRGVGMFMSLFERSTPETLIMVTKD